MNGFPALIEVNDFPGRDYAEKWQACLEELYRIYLATVAFGGLTFRGVRVNCQFRPETFGKHCAFWHMMQEGRIEDDRNIDLERCRRVRWISWVIQNADIDARIRVFRQSPRGSERSWALWLYEEDYVVILWERRDYYLLRTAFLVKQHKRRELERDYQKYVNQNG